MQRHDPLLPRRVVLATVGMLLAGVSLGFFKRAFFGVEINPFTAMAVGFLGLPGAVLVVALRLLM